MENIARGCFISLQPCLCTRSTHIFSSLSLNQSSLLCIAPPPPFVSLFLQFPPLPVLSISIFENFFFPPLSASSATKVPGWSLCSLPHPHPPRSPCQAGEAPRGRGSTVTLDRLWGKTRQEKLQRKRARRCWSAARRRWQVLSLERLVKWGSFKNGRGKTLGVHSSAVPQQGS